MAGPRGADGGLGYDRLSPTVRGVRRHRHHPGKPRWTQVVSNAITRFSGSMTFVALHVVWFGIWIVANLTLPHPFDAFPFGLLTLIVSLEAIFLSTFVLISQNQQSAGSDARAKQDFQTNVYAEVLSELTAAKLGIDPQEVRRTFERRMAEAKDDAEQDQADAR